MKKSFVSIAFLMFLIACNESIVEPELSIAGIWQCNSPNVTLYLSQTGNKTFEGDFYLNELFISGIKGRIIDRCYTFSVAQVTNYDSFALGFVGQLEKNILKSKIDGQILSNKRIISFGNIEIIFKKY